MTISSPRRSKDSFTAAITRYFVPWAKANKFSRQSGRCFVREYNSAIRSILFDAHGFSGKSSVRVLYCVHPVCAYSIEGYLLGHRLADESWDMTSDDKADVAMPEIVTLLEREAIPFFDRLASKDSLRNALCEMAFSSVHDPAWFDAATSLAALGCTDDAIRLLRARGTRTMVELPTQPPHGPVELLEALERGKEAELLELWSERTRRRCKLVSV